MYISDPFVTTPPDDAPLWRYMNLSRFMHLVASRSLYFARQHELDDKWEGVPPASDETIMRKFILGDLKETKQFHAQLRRLAAVNCWHMDDSESVAMWHLYTTGTDGVAIKTSVRRLRYALKDDPNWTYIGEVKYVDYDDPQPEHMNFYTAIQPLFHKRRSFRHEAEVRACIWDFNRPDCVPKRTTGTGFLVPINLRALIQRIVVSPQYPAWAIDSLQALVSQAGLTVTAESSDLLRTPAYESMVKWFGPVKLKKPLKFSPPPTGKVTLP